MLCYRYRGCDNHFSIDESAVPSLLLETELIGMAHDAEPRLLDGSEPRRAIVSDASISISMRVDPFCCARVLQLSVRDQFDIKVLILLERLGCYMRGSYELCSGL